MKVSEPLPPVSVSLPRLPVMTLSLLSPLSVSLYCDPRRYLRCELHGRFACQRDRSGIPVVYMTSASVDEWGSKGVPNSIKPFAPARLVTAVFQLLNRGTPLA